MSEADKQPAITLYDAK